MSTLEEAEWKIEHISAHYIDILGERYTRFGPEAWNKWYGNSEEAVSYPEELERIFQKKLRESTKHTVDRMRRHV